MNLPGGAALRLATGAALRRQLFATNETLTTTGTSTGSGGSRSVSSMFEECTLPSFLFGFVYQNAHYSRLDDQEIAASQSLVIGVNAVALEHNWTDIRRDCAQQSAQRETCDLLASAAELQLAYGENKSRAAGPVVLAALQRAPVSEPVIIHVKGALDTRPATDPKIRERLRQEIQALLAGHVKDRAPPPETWITAAKLQFQAGESVAGFESLVHYVATDNTDTARALKVGFVDPIKVADRQQSKNKSSLLLKPAISSGEDTSEKDSPQE